MTQVKTMTIMKVFKRGLQVSWLQPTHFPTNIFSKQPRKTFFRNKCWIKAQKYLIGQTLYFDFLRNFQYFTIVISWGHRQGLECLSKSFSSFPRTTVLNSNGLSGTVPRFIDWTWEWICFQLHTQCHLHAFLDAILPGFAGAPNCSLPGKHAIAGDQIRMA